jgi:hypothetical protein
MGVPGRIRRSRLRFLIVLSADIGGIQNPGPFEIQDEKKAFPQAHALLPLP